MDTHVEHSKPNVTTTPSLARMIVDRSSLSCCINLRALQVFESKAENIGSPVNEKSTINAPNNAKPAGESKSSGLPLHSFLRRLHFRCSIQGDQYVISRLAVLYPAIWRHRLSVATPAKTSMALYTWPGLGVDVFILKGGAWAHNITHPSCLIIDQAIQEWKVENGHSQNLHREYIVCILWLAYLSVAYFYIQVCLSVGLSVYDT